MPVVLSVDMEQTLKAISAEEDGSYQLLEALGIAVFAEQDGKLIAQNALPRWMSDYYVNHWDEAAGVLSLPPHGMLASLIENMHALCQSGDAPTHPETQIFQEFLAQGGGLAARVTIVPKGKEFLYCIQAFDELEDYRQELLQRLRELKQNERVEHCCSETAGLSSASS